MQALVTLVRRAHACEAGATSIEYGLIATFISILLVAGASAIGSKLDSTFTAVGLGFK